MKTIPQQIKEARLKAGLTQGDLAKSIKSYQANIADIENGIGNPTLSTLKALCIVLKCSFVIEMS